SRTRNPDPYTHRITNFRLSMARADIVAKLLMQYGVPASKLIVIAQADSQPIYHEFMPSGEAGNRRAEIYLDY
ncbi:MAG: OmpA family protein, partial [Rhodospirillales bacterium]|nr:OmpA family protein [Rhodospirillales bacterium]